MGLKNNAYARYHGPELYAGRSTGSGRNGREPSMSMLSALRGYEQTNKSYSNLPNTVALPLSAVQ